MDEILTRRCPRWFWGENKQWIDPVTMRVSFDKEETKLDPAAIKKKQDDQAVTDKKAAAMNVAAQITQTVRANSNATKLASDAAA